MDRAGPRPEREQPPLHRARHPGVRWGLLLLYLCLLTLGFRHNGLGVARPEQFDNFAAQTGSMIYARLAMSEQKGLFSDGGLLLRDVGVPRDRRVRHQLALYVNDLPIRRPLYYRSRPVAQTTLFSLFDLVSPYEDATNASIFRWTTSFLSALCLTGLAGWFLTELGVWSGVFLMVGTLCSPWLTVSGGHLSWFVVFKAHAFLHPFLDPLAWYLPTVPLIYGLTGAWFGQVTLRVRSLWS